MRNTEKVAQALLQPTVTHPRSVLGGFLVVTILLGWQARHFRIDASADTLLTKNNLIYIQTELANEIFSPQEFLLIAYKPRTHPVLSQQTFTALEDISAHLRRLERVESVRSILNVPIFTRTQERLSSKTKPDELTMEHQHYGIEEFRKSLAGHPIYEDLLINKDQTATALQVLFRNDATYDRICREILELQRKAMDGKLSRAERKELKQLQAEVDPIQQERGKIRQGEIEAIRSIVAPYNAEADIFLGGVHVLAYQLVHIIRNDLIVFGSAIWLMICLVLFVLFRKARWVIIPLLCCGCSLVCTIGLFGLLGLKATVISANFIALQFILTLAIVMHLIVQYREYCVEHPAWSQTELVKKTLYRMVRPCLYSGFTTVVGFGSLLTCNIQPVIAFGWMMIIAMGFSLGVSITLFPAMMALCKKEPVSGRQLMARRILDFCKAAALNHNRAVVVISGVLMLVSAGGMLFLDVENSFINYFRDRTRIHKELSFIDAEFGGSTPLDLVYKLGGGEQREKLVLTADTVHTLQKIQEALQPCQGVGKILSVVNFTELARQINKDKPLTEYELTAIYWTMEDSLRTDLLGAFLSPENGLVRFSARIQDTTPGLDRARLLASIRKAMEELGIPTERYQLTSLFVLYQDILQRLFRSQILTLGTAFGVLALTFFATFRSLRIGLIGIIPSLLPTLALLGLMGWLRIPLDMMTITIAAITMGISVDDTIHYTHRYLEELHSSSGKQAVAHTHLSVGFGMLYVSLIIVMGFSLLVFSDFVPSVLFGLLTSFVMILSLVYNLTLLPALLQRHVKRPATTPRH